MQELANLFSNDPAFRMRQSDRNAGLRLNWVSVLFTGHSLSDMIYFLDWSL